jgi:hypothetical protein
MAIDNGRHVAGGENSERHGACQLVVIDGCRLLLSMQAAIDEWSANKTHFFPQITALYALGGCRNNTPRILAARHPRSAAFRVPARTWRSIGWSLDDRLQQGVLT